MRFLFLSREKVKPVRTYPKNGWAHASKRTKTQSQMQLSTSRVSIPRCLGGKMGLTRVEGVDTLLGFVSAPGVVPVGPIAL